jgi:hypothetical protein
MAPLALAASARQVPFPIRSKTWSHCIRQTAYQLWSAFLPAEKVVSDRHQRCQHRNSPSEDVAGSGQECARHWYVPVVAWRRLRDLPRDAQWAFFFLVQQSGKAGPAVALSGWLQGGQEGHDAGEALSGRPTCAGLWLEEGVGSILARIMLPFVVSAGYRDMSVPYLAVDWRSDQ